MPGDTIFAVGALLFGWFVLRLWIAPRKAPACIGAAAQESG
jgi:nitric oxide reductase subunit B